MSLPLSLESLSEALKRSSSEYFPAFVGLLY